VRKLLYDSEGSSGNVHHRVNRIKTTLISNIYLFAAVEGDDVAPVLGR
jgi:hypothetical protein